MTPVAEMTAELRLVVQRAETRAQSGVDQLEDLRTAAIGDLLDAMDRVDPGWGTRLLLAMYPHADAQKALA